MPPSIPRAAAQGVLLFRLPDSERGEVYAGTPDANGVPHWNETRHFDRSTLASALSLTGLRPLDYCFGS
jgi:hypothetical protein